MSVNLLPQELRPKGYLIEFSKTLKKIALVSILVLLVSGFGVLASYFLLRYQVTSSIKKQDEIKSSIKALEQSEQKLILIRDRLDKINQIENSDNINKGVGILGDILGIVKDDVVLRGVELKPTSTEVKIAAGSSLALTRFLNNLTSQLDLVRIDLVSLDYDPLNGYGMKLSLYR